MEEPVSVSFDCIPLRSLPRWDYSLDDTPQQHTRWARLRQAVRQHGAHNSYYLDHGRCEFRLTNDPRVGVVVFHFEGTVLTDESDRRSRWLQLTVDLDGAVCDWLTEAGVAWLRETVPHAVRVEFDRYIETGDPELPRQRLLTMESEIASNGGFVGIGL